MQLIGRYSSPYVRRVAVTMGFYGIDYAHANLTPFGEEKAVVRKFNPLGRVPALVLDVEATGSQVGGRLVGGTRASADRSSIGGRRRWRWGRCMEARHIE